MEIAGLLLKYLDVLVYPFLIGALVLLFRKEVSGILRGDIKAKYKELELTIERTKRALENTRENQNVAIAKVRNTLEDLAPKVQNDSAITNLRVLLSAISLNSYEGEVIKILRKHGGRYPEESLVHYYFQNVSDPWRKTYPEEEALRAAINTLLQKSLVMKENGYLVLHALLLAEDAEQKDLTSG